MKYILIAIALFVGICAAVPIIKGNKFTETDYQYAFVNWMKEHKRSYSASEFGARYNAFKFNMDYVEEWNSHNSSTVLGLNNMADLTNEEYQRIYLGTRIDGTQAVLNAQPYAQTGAANATVDWRNSGAVTGVKDQGQCGSCWSFSSTGAIEGAYRLKGNSLVSLSEQNLMDCSTSYGNAGCNGGEMTAAFQYVIDNKGVDTEAFYPYTAKDGTCHFSATNIGATISAYKSVAAGSEVALAAAIDIGPVSVAIDASKITFQLYKSGIYHDILCSSTRLDHGVLAVGYDTDYYIVKNSWGTSWGQAGYIDMSRNRNNNCGIATSAAYPIV